MKRLIFYLSLLGCMTGISSATTQNKAGVDNPRKALGLDTLKQIKPIDLREPGDKTPGNLFAYRGRFYVARSADMLRKKQLIPQDFKAVYEIYVTYEPAIAEYQSKLPAKHREIQTVVIIEDRK